MACLNADDPEHEVDTKPKLSFPCTSKIVDAVFLSDKRCFHTKVKVQENGYRIYQN